MQNGWERIANVCVPDDLYFIINGQQGYLSSYCNCALNYSRIGWAFVGGGGGVALGVYCIGWRRCGQNQ